MQTKQFIDKKWVFSTTDLPLAVGDTVEFLTNGVGRGGHFRAFAEVTKVKPKTFDCVELDRSHNPGERWNVLKTNLSLVKVLPSIESHN